MLMRLPVSPNTYPWAYPPLGQVRKLSPTRILNLEEMRTSDTCLVSLLYLSLYLLKGNVPTSGDEESHD